MGPPLAFYSASSAHLSPPHELLPVSSPGDAALLLLSGIFAHCPPPTEGKGPSAIIIALTNHLPLLNFSISDGHFVSCLTQLATAHSSPDLTYSMAITA